MTPKPSVRPNKASALTVVSLPTFISLSHRGITVKSDFHFVDVVRSEILWRVTRFGDHFRLAIHAPLGIDANKIVGKNAFDDAAVAAGD